MQSYHDYYLVCHCLNVYFTVVKISELAKWWLRRDITQITWVSKYFPFDILIATLTTDTIYRSNLKKAVLDIYPDGKKKLCKRNRAAVFTTLNQSLQFSRQTLLIKRSFDTTLMMSFSMTSQHSGGQTTVHTASSMCDHLAHWHIPDTDASLMPLCWHRMLVGFLAKLLAGLCQVLAVWWAGLIVVSTVCPFRPTRARLATKQGTSRAKPSPTHSHVLENSWWDAQRVV